MPSMSTPGGAWSRGPWARVCAVRRKASARSAAPAPHREIPSLSRAAAADNSSTSVRNSSKALTWRFHATTSSCDHPVATSTSEMASAPAAPSSGISPGVGSGGEAPSPGSPSRPPAPPPEVVAEAAAEVPLSFRWSSRILRIRFWRLSSLGAEGSREEESPPRSRRLRVEDVLTLLRSDAAERWLNMRSGRGLRDARPEERLGVIPPPPPPSCSGL
mmetsp:Transcript_2644/g.5836  ORF Transcript_2644/g.5836 Transcript_2644/m.5836 type:complete len:217 (+) Transcript_2644:934-1584(+)